ncbi:Antibiotic biosynthesis monooxygenase [Fimbriiglobus ruber]|uniref:Antibiotic biosynthesis monooxygenase n=1 Tax=Fimbriiglobus ruber TaxID=1908690 RepID=A0A225EAU0_9BACT|nr:Antibiotic biosynthesis monooxygenase [Fimbriiglobus ruber]
MFVSGITATAEDGSIVGQGDPDAKATQALKNIEVDRHLDSHACHAEVIRYKIAEGWEPAFEDAYRQAQTYLAKLPHCLGYELTRCLKESNRYVLLIRWESVDGHMKGFRGSPAFQPFVALIAPFFKQIEEMEHYEPTGIELTKAA